MGGQPKVPLEHWGRSTTSSVSVKDQLWLSHSFSILVDQKDLLPLRIGSEPFSFKLSTLLDVSL